MLLAPNAKRFTFWAVLGAGILAGAAAANGHATSPPGVTNPRTNAGIASVAPDADLLHRPIAAQAATASTFNNNVAVTPANRVHAEPVQKALSTPDDNALVFLDSPKTRDADTTEASGSQAEPIASNGPRFALLLVLVFGLLGAAAFVAFFLKKGRGSNSDAGPRLELVDQRVPCDHAQACDCGRCRR